MNQSLKFAAAGVLGCLIAAGPATAENISVNGSTTVLPILQQATEAYTAANPGTTFSVAGTGSGNGIRAVIDGMARVGMSSRWIQDGEVRQAINNGVYIVPFAIAVDGIVPVVHPSNPVQTLTLEQLRGIYNGSITNWNQLGGSNSPIVSISRDSSSGTYEVWVDVVLQGDRVSPRTQLLASNGAIVQAVSSNRNAIGYIGIGYLSGDSVKAARVEGVQPTHDNVRNASWPITRTLWVFTNNWPQGETLNFINFLLHPEQGQKHVAETGYVTLY